jgi:hypothetical protein
MTMIDSLTEEIVTLAEAAKLCPKRRGGRPTHPSCLYRWTSAGCKGVVLESLQVGGTRCTSREALARFFVKLTAAANGTPALPPVSKQQRRAMEAVEKQLDAERI